MVETWIFRRIHMAYQPKYAVGVDLNPDFSSESLKEPPAALLNPSYLIPSRGLVLVWSIDQIILN